MSKFNRICLILAVAGGCLSPLALHGQDPDSTSVVRGRVRDHDSGLPLSGAAVSLASGPGGTEGIGTRVTDTDGRFLFRRVPPGTFRLVVSSLGYREVRDTLPVEPGSELDLSLSMSVSPIRLDPIVVVSDRRDLGIMGDFERRRRVRSGTFFDREDIEARHPYLFSDLLRMVPGARVVSRGLGGNTVRLRGNCTPELWVDGVPLMTIEGMDDILPTMDIEAVEVYHGVSLPVQFGSNSCGGIIVWTRRGERLEGDRSFWKRFAIAAGVVLLAILATG